MTIGGASGSPVFNANGEVISIHRAGCRRPPASRYRCPSSTPSRCFLPPSGRSSGSVSEKIHRYDQRAGLRTGRFGCTRVSRLDRHLRHCLYSIAARLNCAAPGGNGCLSGSKSVKARARINHSGYGLQSATSLGFCGARLKGSPDSGDSQQCQGLEGAAHPPIRHSQLLRG